MELKEPGSRPLQAVRPEASPSTSGTSSGAPSTSPGPLPLPPLKRPVKGARGVQPPETIEQLAAPVSKRRPLPQDPKELEDAIRGCRVMVRPIVLMLSKLAVAAGTSPLDKEEQECCTLGFSAWMYEEGGALSGRVLAGLALASVGLPRTLEAVEKRQARKAAAKREAQGLPPLPSPHEVKPA